MFCGARTRRGGSCKNRPVQNRRRCRMHGGASTGPKTWEGKQKIAAARRKAGEDYRLANPRLFQGEMSARHERRVRKAFKEAKQQRQREKLQQEAREWTAQWKASRTFTPTTQKVFHAFARTASEEDKAELFEIARERQREIAKPLPPQPVPADSTLAFLGREIERANSAPVVHRSVAQQVSAPVRAPEQPRAEVDIER